MKSVSYSTYTRLTCECRAEVIICLTSGDKVFGGPFVEGTILSVDLIADTRGRAKYQYAVGYEDGLLVDQNQPLLSGDINGIFCKDCFTDWVGQQVAQTCYIEYTCNPFFVYADTIPGNDNKSAYFCGQGISGPFDSVRGGFVQVNGLQVPGVTYTNNPGYHPATLYEEAGAVKICAAEKVFDGNSPRPSIQFWTGGKMRLLINDNGELRFLGSRENSSDRSPGEPNCLQVASLTPDGDDNMQLGLCAAHGPDLSHGAYLSLAGNNIIIPAGRGAVALQAGNNYYGGIMDIGANAPYREYPPSSHYAGYPISGAIIFESEGYARWVIAQYEFMSVPDSPGEGAHGGNHIWLRRNNSLIELSDTSVIKFGANGTVTFGAGVDQYETALIRCNTQTNKNKTQLQITAGPSIDPTRAPYITLNGNEYSSHPGNIEIETGIGVSIPGVNISLYARSSVGNIGGGNPPVNPGGVHIASDGADIDFYLGKYTWHLYTSGNLENNAYNGGDVVFNKSDTGIKSGVNPTWSTFQGYVAIPPVCSGYISLHVGGVPYKILVAA